jgi:hypothetical protein
VNDPLRAQQVVRRQVRRRRRWRRVRVALLVLVASTAVVAAAYGIDRLVVVVHKFYAEHHHAHRPADAAVTTTSTTSTTVAGPPRCDSPQLTAVVSDWRETSGTVEETVTLTNISATACTLTGYPVLGAAAEDGTPLPAPNDDLASVVPSDGGSIPVSTTAPATATTLPAAPVALVHGGRASFELTFANVCDQVLEPGEAATGAAKACYAGLFLEVTPPQGTSPLLVTEPVRLTYATSGFQVGPFQEGSGPPLTGPPPLTSETTTTTGVPTTGVPTTGVPTTGVPTTGVPAAGAPTGSPPTTSP